MTPLDRKETAKLFRELARSYESHFCGFTCIEVDRMFGGAFSTERRAYARIFGFPGNEAELWDMEDCHDMRILMLCFAAAMAETGDFYEEIL